MKRSQKEALGFCGGRCPEARELAAQVDESADVFDRWAARVRELEAEVARLRVRLRIADSLRRGLAA